MLEFGALNQQFTSLLDSLPEADPGKYPNLRDWIKELGLGENLDNYIKSSTEISVTPITKMESGKLKADYRGLPH